MNNYMVEKEELKQGNAQLNMKINTMEKSIDLLSKKVKYYEDQISGAASAARVERTSEETKKKEEETTSLRKVLDLAGSSEDLLRPSRSSGTSAAGVAKSQPASSRGKKEIKKAPATVQVSLTGKGSSANN